jgi:hypothetical protein
MGDSVKPDPTLPEALPEHVRRNRATWDIWAEKFVADGERCWAREDPVWGIWMVPEAVVGVPPADATTHYPFVTLDWSRQWPCEEVWKARKRA